MWCEGERGREGGGREGKNRWHYEAWEEEEEEEVRLWELLREGKGKEKEETRGIM